MSPETWRSSGREEVQKRCKGQEVKFFKIMKVVKNGFNGRRGRRKGGGADMTKENQVYIGFTMMKNVKEWSMEKKERKKIKKKKIIKNSSVLVCCS